MIKTEVTRRFQPGSYWHTSVDKYVLRRVNKVVIIRGQGLVNMEAEEKLLCLNTSVFTRLFLKHKIFLCYRLISNPKCLQLLMNQSQMVGEEGVKILVLGRLSGGQVSNFHTEKPLFNNSMYIIKKRASVFSFFFLKKWINCCGKGQTMKTADIFSVLLNWEIFIIIQYWFTGTKKKKY